MANFNLKLVSSNGIFYEGYCNALIIPTPDGEQEIMSHHEEMMIAVTVGSARFKEKEDGKWTSVIVGNGYCQIANNRAILLADTIERPEEIDVARAQRALERANERLRQKQSNQEYYMTRAAMARALNRLKETEKFLGQL